MKKYFDYYNTHFAIINEMEFKQWCKFFEIRFAKINKYSLQMGCKLLNEMIYKDYATNMIDFKNSAIVGVKDNKATYWIPFSEFEAMIRQGNKITI